jgi:LPXTG-motif cell wall-anchored protein
MKKLALTIAILLGLTMTTFADGGLFNRGNNAKNGQASGYIYFGVKTEGDNAGSPAMPLLPQHGEDTNQPAPLGSGIAVLMGLGAAYLVGKRRREE